MSDHGARPPMPSQRARLRPLIALLGALALFGLAGGGSLGWVVPSKRAVAVGPSEPVTPRLAHRLLIVIVDGLRWDVASDPERMPHFARAMREHASGELWAGRVSMTTSAILTLVTGERGGLEQIVFNADPSPPPYDAWLNRARQRGLVLMQVGDPAWSLMYGSAFAETRLDPKGVAIDVDFNPQTFRDARELRAKSPDVLIAHFVTPDHQAHAHTVHSRAFAQHIRGYDRDLDAFLRELAGDWTVFVLGDHGASDSGTHGTDIPIQRRSAIYAYGPGITAERPAPRRIDQADLAGTFAALLGLPLPGHSRGHVLVDWLALSSDARRALACSDAERAIRLARSHALDEVALRAERRAHACRELEPPVALAAARDSVAIVDAGIEATTGLASPIVPPLVVLTLLIGIGTTCLVLGRKAFGGLLVALALGAIAIALTWGVERLPDGLPKTARVVLFVLGNLVALGLLVVPGKLRVLAERAAWLAPALFPGLLLATYTTNAQPEAYVAAVVGFCLIALIGGLGAPHRTLRSSRLVLHPGLLAIAAAALAFLFLPGTRTTDVFPEWLRRDGVAGRIAGSAAIALSIAVLGARSRSPRRWAIVACGSAIAIGALALRRVVPAWPGRAAIVVAIALAIVWALRGRKLAALSACFSGYALIARDFELVALAATLIVAHVAGLAFARQRADSRASEQPLELAQLLLVATFLFGLAFVQRIGIQSALDFGAMDWGVAGFGDPHVPAWLVGSALGLKYELALLALIGVFAAELPRPRVLELLCALYVAFFARAVVLVAMFLIAGASFWTGLRVLGDLPFGFLWSTAIAIAWIAVDLRWRAELTSKRCSECPSSACS